MQEFIDQDESGNFEGVSISESDKLLSIVDWNEFLRGFVARNPKDHSDLWYVARKYFDENLEEVN